MTATTLRLGESEGLSGEALTHGDTHAGEAGGDDAGVRRLGLGPARHPQLVGADVADDDVVRGQRRAQIADDARGFSGTRAGCVLAQLLAHQPPRYRFRRVTALLAFLGSCSRHNSTSFVLVALASAAAGRLSSLSRCPRCGVDRRAIQASRRYRPHGAVGQHVVRGPPPPGGCRCVHDLAVAVAMPDLRVVLGLS